ALQCSQTPQGLAAISQMAVKLKQQDGYISILQQIGHLPDGCELKPIGDTGTKDEFAGHLPDGRELKL
ncbi:hypothetical protein, partial [Avibacterium endocarditidis]